MVFHWSLNDSKSPQVYRTLLSIRTDLNNTVVWMVSTRSLISESFSPCKKPLVGVVVSLIASFSHGRLLLVFHKVRVM